MFPINHKALWGHCGSRSGGTGSRSMMQFTTGALYFHLNDVYKEERAEKDPSFHICACTYTQHTIIYKATYSQRLRAFEASRSSLITRKVYAAVRSNSEGAHWPAFSYITRRRGERKEGRKEGSVIPASFQWIMGSFVPSLPTYLSTWFIPLLSHTTEYRSISTYTLPTLTSRVSGFFLDKTKSVK